MGLVIAKWVITNNSNSAPNHVWFDEMLFWVNRQTFTDDYLRTALHNESLGRAKILYGADCWPTAYLRFIYLFFDNFHIFAIRQFPF